MRVVIEITEQDRTDSYSKLGISLDELRHRGARVAVDDAGAGFAGLQQILELAPDIIKLDITLTRGIDNDPVRRSLTKCLLAFAAEIGALIVAEGIETLAELETVRSVGVTLGQGYLLGRPTIVTNVEANLGTNSAFNPNYYSTDAQVRAKRSLAVYPQVDSDRRPTLDRAIHLWIMRSPGAAVLSVTPGFSLDRRDLARPSRTPSAHAQRSSGNA